MHTAERPTTRLGRCARGLARLALIAAAGLALASAAPASERLKDISTVTGIRNNQLIGYGLAVGLDGTGDQTTQTPFTRQSVV